MKLEIQVSDSHKMYEYSSSSNEEAQRSFLQSQSLSVVFSAKLPHTDSDPDQDIWEAIVLLN